MNDGGGDDLVIEPNIKMMKMVYFIYHIFHHHSSCLCQVPEIWLFLLIQPQQSILLEMSDCSCLYSPKHALGVFSVS